MIKRDTLAQWSAAGRVRNSGPRSAVNFAVIMTLGIVVMGTGCASLPGPFLTKASGKQVAARPSLAVDYDVLIAEMALGDQDYAAAKEALGRAIKKDSTSAYLEMRASRVDAHMEDLRGAIAHAKRAVELDPEDEEPRILLGGLYRVARDVEGAKNALLDSEGVPVSDGAALLLYQVYFESDRLEEALEITEYLVANRPDILNGFMALATIYQRLGKPNEAERVLRAALVEHPDRFVLFTRLASLKRAVGDRLGEIDVYREALERRPTHYGSLLSLAEVLVTANDVEAAIETYEAIVANYPNDLKAVRRLASLEFAAGRPAKAATVLDQGLIDFPGHFEFAYSLGQVRRSMGELARAREVFASIPLGDSSYVEARVQIVSILEEAGDYPSALAEVNSLRTIAPSRALEFHAAGLFLRTGDFDTGKAILDTVLAEDEGDEEALYQLGVFYGMAEHSDHAIKTMMRVLEINPNNAHALNYVGYTWAERGENLERAEDFIVRALAQRPNDGFITDSLGWIYFIRGRDLLRNESAILGKEFLIRARDQLNLAAELTGGDPVVSEHLGDVYRVLDEKRRAYEYYQQAVDMNHREDEQPDLLDKLDNLRRELGEL